ncbi:MAG: hypothetical protein JSR66_05485 [Proteobacteria bacterium]|nr:hypothetical protein [Pseudomonadota bacterium]
MKKGSTVTVFLPPHCSLTNHGIHLNFDSMRFGGRAATALSEAFWKAVPMAVGS